MNERQLWCMRMRTRILRHVEIHESGFWIWLKRAKRWKLKNPRLEFPPMHTIIRRAA
jgi:hypothetical protein